MKISIDKIVIGERIRVDNGNIEAFAENIRSNGLINPLTVMRVEGGELKLLAGYRRLLAAQLLGWTEIDVYIMSPFDAEAALLIEISENEQRKGFTVAEVDKYGFQIEEIEKEKARIRKAEGQLLGGTIGGKGYPKNDNSLVDCSPPSYDKKIQKLTRDAVGRQLNMSGRQYERVKYIAANAPQEMIDQIDRGERSVYGAYEELRANEKAVPTPAPVVSAMDPEPIPEHQPATPPPAPMTLAPESATTEHHHVVPWRHRRGLCGRTHSLIIRLMSRSNRHTAVMLAVCCYIAAMVFFSVVLVF